MPTPPSIGQATTIGSFGADFERYYLQMATIGHAFEEKPQSRFFLSDLQKKIIEVDRFVDRLDSVAVNDPLPEELTTAPEMTALILGMFGLTLSDGLTCDIPMYYCPSLADTIVSPQHFTSSSIADLQYNGYCLIDMSGCCCILLLHSNDNYTSFIALKKSNGLYFISGSMPDSLGSRVSWLSTKPQLLADLWHQRLGHPGPTQLGVLAKHSTCMPSLITMHPMHSYQACNDEKIQRADKGPI
jgi:hypothetical protein